MTFAKLEDFFEPEEPIHTEQLIGYASLEIVWKSLKDWGFSVDEYQKIPYSEGEYRAWITGQLEEKSPEQQEFLRTMFELKFPGSPTNLKILIHFNVRRQA